MKILFALALTLGSTSINAALVDDVKQEMINIQNDLPQDYTLNYNIADSTKDNVRIQNLTVVQKNPLSILFEVDGDTIVTQQGNQTAFKSLGAIKGENFAINSPLSVTFTTNGANLFPFKQENFLSILTNFIFELGKGSFSGNDVKIAEYDTINFELTKIKENPIIANIGYQLNLKNLNFPKDPNSKNADQIVHNESNLAHSYEIKPSEYGLINFLLKGSVDIPPLSTWESLTNLDIGALIKKSAADGYGITIDSYKYSDNFAEATAQLNLHGLVRGNIPGFSLKSSSQGIIKEAFTKTIKEMLLVIANEPPTEDMDPALVDLLRKKGPEIVNLFPNLHLMGTIDSTLNANVSLGTDGMPTDIDFLTNTQFEKPGYGFTIQGNLKDPLSKINGVISIKVRNYEKWLDEGLTLYANAMNIYASQFPETPKIVLSPEKITFLKNNLKTFAINPESSGKDFETVIKIPEEGLPTIGNKPLLQSLMFLFFSLYQ